MNRSIPIQKNVQIMPKLATNLLSLALMLTSGIVVAQVDTGGGMGGTGARRQSELIDPAGGNGNNPDCPKENSIGIIEVKNKNTQQILRVPRSNAGIKQLGDHRALFAHRRKNHRA
jgi:hypothetical protein